MANGKRRRVGHGREPEAIDETGPIDITAVRRDDSLIDAIAGDGPVSTDSPEEFQLAALMANWRADVIAEPLPPGPDLDVIVAAVNQEIGARRIRVAAVGSKRNRLRYLRPLGVTAAAVALITGGMTAFSYSAQPGDPLWKVKQVVFSEQANSTVAEIDTRSILNDVQRDIEHGNPAEAAASLVKAKARAAEINDPAKKKEALERLDRLTVMAQNPPVVTSETSEAVAPHGPSSGRTTPPGRTPPPPPPSSAPGIPGLPGLPALPTLPSLPPLPLPELPQLPHPGQDSGQPGSPKPTGQPTSGQPAIPLPPPLQNLIPNSLPIPAPHR